MNINYLSLFPDVEGAARDANMQTHWIARIICSPQCAPRRTPHRLILPTSSKSRNEARSGRLLAADYVAMEGKVAKSWKTSRVSGVASNFS